jgi:branched-chain amino acid aminotransferase
MDIVLALSDTYFMSIRVYIDGKVREPENAMVSVFDRGFLFGDSVYETIALLNHRLIFLTEHLDRLKRSASRIYLDLPPRSAIEEAIGETVTATGDSDARLRVIVTRGVGTVDIDPATAKLPRLIVIAQLLGAPTSEMLECGVAVEMVSVARSAPGNIAPAVKSGNYLNSVLAMAEARRRRPQANEAILCSGNGSVAEGATSNIFSVERGELQTPGLEVGILDGVTRGKVLELASANGIEARELSFLSPDKLRSAEEVFLTSAVRGVLPVTMVDGVRVGGGSPGPVTRRLLGLYRRLVDKV